MITLNDDDGAMVLDDDSAELYEGSAHRDLAAPAFAGTSEFALFEVANGPDAAFSVSGS